MSLLRVENLRVAFGEQEVVHGVSLDIQPGEKLALVGESGSGKTVTAMSLLGLVEGARCSGRVLLSPASDVGSGASANKREQTAIGGSGCDLLQLPPVQLRAVRGRDIAMIFQEPMTALNPVFTIGDQIGEVLRVKMGMTRQAAAQEVVRLLERTGIDQPAQRANAYAHQLSGGQRQRAMIAMALAARPRLLLADEPTTALDPGVRLQILALLDDLQKEMGMAVLLITHDLALVRRFADRVAEMERGHIVEQGAVGAVFQAPQHACTQELLHHMPARVAAPCAADAQMLITGKQVQVRYARAAAGWRSWLRQDGFMALHGADFSLRSGETLGVVGESGSGKSTLALAVLGLVKGVQGVTVLGRPWGGGRATDLQNRKDLQVVFQDPFSALSPRLTLEELVGEGLLVHAPELSRAQRRVRVAAALAEVGLQEAQFPGLLARYAHQFSGGQRQRIAIARALVVQPRVLVLDEPTSALDASMARQILLLLQRLQTEKGLSYLLISHDVAVIRAMAHRVMVMQGGRILESGTLESVFGAPTTTYTRDLLAAAE